MKKSGIFFLLIIIICTLFSLYILNKVVEPVVAYANFLQELKVVNYRSYAVDYLKKYPSILVILSSYITIIVLSSALIINKLKSFRNKHSITLPIQILVLGLIVLIPFTLDYYFFKSKNVPCGQIFYKCHNGWHYEKNSFGHRIDVHYLVDYKGKRISDSFVGCGYDGTPADYELLLSKIEGIGSTDNNTEVIYFFPDGSSARLDREKKPYLDTIQLSTFYNNEIYRLMFEGTGCR
jgi:hypothetical protein